jgi:hypothetical protein
VKMRQAMVFHPEWGCLAPAPNFLRTMRTVALATAIGAAVGGGAVLSYAAYSDKGQTSVAQRTLVEPVPAAPTAIKMSQSSPEKTSYAQSKEVRLSENRPNDPPANELNTTPPAPQSAVTAPAKVRAATGGGSAKTGAAPTPAIAIRPKHLAQRPRREDLSPPRPPQHSLASRTDSNLLQRFWAGLTTAIEHVWSPSTSPGSRTSRARGDASATAA